MGLRKLVNGSEGGVPRASLNEAIEILSRRGWLASCDEEARSQFIRMARLRMYPAGAVVYLEGDEPNGLYGLVSGALDVSIPRSDGSDFTIHRAQSGFWIGDLATISQRARLVSIRTASDATLLHLGYQGLQSLLRENPTLYRDLYRLTYDNFAMTSHLFASVSMPSSEARVASRLLLQLACAPNPDGRVMISQTDLAELVALSLPTLQRTLRRLTDLGYIEQRYREIRVSNRPGLLEVVGRI